jgi:hypothetical protein
MRWYCETMLGLAPERLREHILRAGHVVAGNSQ